MMQTHISPRLCLIQEEWRMNIQRVLDGEDTQIHWWPNPTRVVIEPEPFAGAET